MLMSFQNVLSVQHKDIFKIVHASLLHAMSVNDEQGVPSSEMTNIAL